MGEPQMRREFWVCEWRPKREGGTWRFFGDIEEIEEHEIEVFTDESEALVIVEILEREGHEARAVRYAPKEPRP